MQENRKPLLHKTLEWVEQRCIGILWPTIKDKTAIQYATSPDLPLLLSYNRSNGLMHQTCLLIKPGSTDVILG